MTTIIDKVSDFLQQSLPDTKPKELTFKDDIIKLRLEVLRLQVDARAVLVLQRERNRHPKDKNYTDLDRGIMLESAVAEYQKEYDTLHGLSDLLSSRSLDLR